MFFAFDVCARKNFNVFRMLGRVKFRNRQDFGGLLITAYFVDINKTFCARPAAKLFRGKSINMEHQLASFCDKNYFLVFWCLISVDTQVHMPLRKMFCSFLFWWCGIYDNYVYSSCFANKKFLGIEIIFKLVCLNFYTNFRFLVISKIKPSS